MKSKSVQRQEAALMYEMATDVTNEVIPQNAMCDHDAFEFLDDIPSAASVEEPAIAAVSFGCRCLKVSILTVNFPEMGIFSPKFCTLFTEIVTRRLLKYTSVI